MNQLAAIDGITWGANPIKLQGNMSLLHTSVFLVNMLGALVQLPAITHFLKKPSTPRRSADAKASIELAGDTA